MPQSIPTLSFRDGTLTLEGIPPDVVASGFGPKMWHWDDRALLWRTMAYNYQSVLECLAPGTRSFQDHVPAWQAVCWTKSELHPPREEQGQAIDCWQLQKRGILIMPTGTGKTEVALHILQQAKCSALVVAPVRDLMYQWQRRIHQSLGYDAGVIGDNVFQVKPISVTTYDSACIHMPKLGNRFKLLIFDECHHLPGAIRGDAARMAASPWRLGLTATLDRQDSRYHSITDLIGPVVYELGIKQVRGKSLADYDIYRIAVELEDHERERYQALSATISQYMYDRMQEDDQFDWKMLCHEAGSNYEANRILAAHREKQSIEDRAEEKLRVIEDLLHLHHGTPAIIFAGSNAMARKVSTTLLLPCLLSHCGKKERANYLDGLRDGRYSAIVANQILDEGVDIPAVKIAIVIGGMASNRQSQQRLGRILRKSHNERAVLYEVVCQDTNEIKRSRTRRRNDAYSGTRHI